MPFRCQSNTIPVWLMRQAGRYQKRYRLLREKYDFPTLCKEPGLSAEVALGAIHDFDFDAAILFSDILFTLEFMGLELEWHDSKPVFPRPIKSIKDLSALSPKTDMNAFFAFQRTALDILKTQLPTAKNLIGFVGGPFTLFLYATAKNHASVDPLLFAAFMEKIRPILKAQLLLQAEAHPDVLAIFDTSAGLLPTNLFEVLVRPEVEILAKAIKEKHPTIDVLYFSKNSTLAHWNSLQSLPLDIFAIGPDCSLNEALATFGASKKIQGNLRPELLLNDWSLVEAGLKALLDSLEALPEKNWIFSLGHGVLPSTPEVNIKRLVDFLR